MKKFYLIKIFDFEKFYLIKIFTPESALLAPKFIKLQNKNPQLNSDLAIAEFANISISPSSGEGALEN